MISTPEFLTPNFLARKCTRAFTKKWHFFECRRRLLHDLVYPLVQLIPIQPQNKPYFRFAHSDVEGVAVLQKTPPNSGLYGRIFITSQDELNLNFPFHLLAIYFLSPTSPKISPPTLSTSLPILILFKYLLICQYSRTTDNLKRDWEAARTQEHPVPRL